MIQIYLDMQVGREILKTAFFDKENPVGSRLERIAELREMPVKKPFDDAVLAATDAYVSLLSGCDPRENAEEILENCQAVSQRILDTDYTGELAQNAGESTEVAVHGLAWWGVLHDKRARYTRLTTFLEDSSSSSENKEGYDLVVRGIRRRRKVQIKSKLPAATRPRKFAAALELYDGDIVVIAPSMLLDDPDARDVDLHSALCDGNHKYMKKAWDGLLTQLQTQKQIGRPGGNYI